MRADAPRMPNAMRRLAQQEVSRALAAHRDQSVEARAAESRLHTIEELENSLEGHVPGTRAIVEAWQRGELRGIEGIVSNLITTDERYARALDVAFGVRLSNVVTTTSEDAERCVEFLNRKEAGRATFLAARYAREPGRASPRRPAWRDYRGFWATRTRSCAPRRDSSGIVNFLVGNVLIVTTLEVGIELVRGRGLRDTIVTLGGEQITGGGAITGDGFVRERSILSRRFQAASLREALVGMRAQLEEAERGLRAAHLRADAAIGARDAARERQGRIESQLVGLRAERSALGSEVERMHERFGDGSRGGDGTARAGGAIPRARTRARARRADGPAGRRRTSRGLKWSWRACARKSLVPKRRKRQLTRRVPELRERAAALTAERDASKARLAMLDQDSERGGLAREEMLAQIVGTDGRNPAQPRARRGPSQRRHHARFAARERLAASAKSLPRVRRSSNRSVRAAEQQERETADGGRAASHAARPSRGRARDARFAVRTKSRDQRRVCRRRETLSRRARRGRGGIAAPARRARTPASPTSTSTPNPSAARLRSGSSFCATSSTTSPKLGKRCSIRFAKSSVRRKRSSMRPSRAYQSPFRVMYGRLFAGGEAKMWQTQPENLSETGIEIAVRPPGKKADAACSALRRRACDDGSGLDLCADRDQTGALLSSRRSRCRARRRQHRPLLRDGPGIRGGFADAHRHAQ